jgi:hypothetical protein
MPAPPLVILVGGSGPLAIRVDDASRVTVRVLASALPPVDGGSEIPATALTLGGLPLTLAGEYLTLGA